MVRESSWRPLLSNQVRRLELIASPRELRHMPVHVARHQNKPRIRVSKRAKIPACSRDVPHRAAQTRLQRGVNFPWFFRLLAGAAGED